MKYGFLWKWGILGLMPVFMSMVSGCLGSAQKPTAREAPTLVPKDRGV